jgi:polyphosphate glucokinase
MISDVRARGKRTLCIDIGGSGIKTLVLDERGKVVSPRLRKDTPNPATPAAVLAIVEKLAAAQQPFDRISCGFPGVIKHGAPWTAVNLHSKWIGFPLEKTLSERFGGKPARIANDAAIQGLGAVSGRGLEMVVTLGTGVGSALYRDGVLVVPLETGHHPFRKGKTYEEYLGKKGLKKAGRKKWNKLLQKAIGNWQGLFNYDRLFIGGGNAEKIRFQLPENAQIASNQEGLLGGLGLWQSLTYHRQPRGEQQQQPEARLRVV